jgi:Phage integrase family
VLAKDFGYTSVNPVSEVKKFRERVTEENGEIGILSVEDTEKLFRAADPEVIPFLTFSYFCGIRVATLEKLDWSDIKYDEKRVIVPSYRGKRQERYPVTLSENALTWLRPHVKVSGPLLVRATATNRFSKIKGRPSASTKYWQSRKVNERALANLKTLPKEPLGRGLSGIAIDGRSRHLPEFEAACSLWQMEFAFHTFEAVTNCCRECRIISKGTRFNQVFLHRKSSPNNIAWSGLFLANGAYWRLKSSKSVKSLPIRTISPLVLLKCMYLTIRKITYDSVLRASFVFQEPIFTAITSADYGNRLLPLRPLFVLAIAH